MNIHIAGGVGEHGRNCLLVSGLQDTFLVDCGLMTGEENPNPRLTPEQIRSAEWLLLTHSHQDHTGAYPWLVAQGFSGRVVLSAPTLEQLPFDIPDPILIRPGQQLALNERLTVGCGRSGHCVGSLWYQADLDDRRLLFSGDYTEDTTLYACDKLRGHTADVAFLDSARDSALGSAEVLMARTLKLVSDTVRAGRAVVLPVPRHGRGLELMQLLRGQGHFRLDEDSQRAKDSIQRYPEWFKAPLRPGASMGGSIYFISDTQLKRPQSRAKTERLVNEGAQVLFTGHVQEGSFAMRLLKMGQATLIPYPTHASDRLVDLLSTVNHFDQVVRTHSRRHPAPENLNV